MAIGVWVGLVWGASIVVVAASLIARRDQYGEIDRHVRGKCGTAAGLVAGAACLTVATIALAPFFAVVSLRDWAEIARGRVHLAEFKALTRRLHELDLRGLLDSEEAEALREASDPHWYAMTESQREEAARYSGWLDDNVTEPGEAPAE